MRTRLPALMALTILAVGCLQKETTHTLYLDPDGSVTWRVIEDRVRSNTEDPAERRAEEEAFIASVRSWDHAVYRALFGLGARWADSRIEREERPYTVITEARFDSIERLAEGFLEQVALPGEVEWRRIGEQVRFTMVVYPDRADESELDGEEPVLALIEDAERYRIVLTEGVFVDAVGFDLVDGDTTAVPEEPDQDEIDRNDGAVIYSLIWTAP